MTADRKSVMVRFPPKDPNAGFTERMHCIPLGNGIYQVENSPFHAFNISFGDKIDVIGESNDLTFKSVVSRGGHSTYRVRLPIGQNHDYFLEHWTELEALGCSYEGSSLDQRYLYAIDIPPAVDVAHVYRLLEDGESSGNWEFEEAHYAGDTTST